MTKTKKRNRAAQDVTLINLRALKKVILSMSTYIEMLDKRLIILEIDFQKLTKKTKGNKK